MYKIYPSSLSKEVRLTTGFILLVFGLLSWHLLMVQNLIDDAYFKFILVLVLLSATCYFYATAFKRVKLSANALWLERNVGHTTIALTDIKQISTTGAEQLLFNISSKGFFGYNGSVAGASSRINNRAKVLRIVCHDGQQYLFSVNEPHQLIKAVLAAQKQPKQASKAS